MTALVSKEYLTGLLQDTRSRTHELLAGLDDEQMMGPILPIVNPPLWEIAHVANFYEAFILQDLDGEEQMIPNGNEIYDSFAIEHGTRWDLPLLPLNETLAYMEDVNQRLIDRLPDGMVSENDSHIYQMGVFHEDMHTEAYTYTRQTHGYSAPNFAVAADLNRDDIDAGALPGDVDVPGGKFQLGSTADAPFIFDNEKWAHEQNVHPFKIARAALTNEEYAAFVDDDGYKRRELWHDVGWGWRQGADADHPLYWIPEGPGKWRMRRFDRIIDLPPDEAIIHVNWYEASAYCNWAGRRLPTEIEWEVAACCAPSGNGNGYEPGKRNFPWGDDKNTVNRANLDGRGLGCVDVAAFPGGDSAFGCRQMLGNVWEWTSSNFEPYPGFSADAYKEYSEPVFGTRKVLRGGAWGTRSRMVNNMYRNFFTPERRDVMGGFRTCAPHVW